MTVEQVDKIDTIGLEKDTGKIVMTVTDDLEWGEMSHLLLIQRKLNAYLDYIESDQLLESYPDARDRDVEIGLICHHEPDEQGLEFLDNCRQALAEAGCQFQFGLLEVSVED